MVNRNERTLMLGGKIKRLRDEKNISLDELANNAKVDKNTISRIEKGLGSPSLDTIVNISHALKVSPEKLLGYGELREKKDYVVFRRKERKNIPRKIFFMITFSPLNFLLVHEIDAIFLSAKSNGPIALKSKTMCSKVKLG